MRILPMALAFLLAATLLTGCTQSDKAPPRAATPADLGYDPSAIHVEGSRLVNATIPSFDGSTDLAAFIRSPLTNDTLPDGTAPHWPVVIFLHGWGEGKESYAGGRGGVPGSEAGSQAGRPDRLRDFAEAGFISVAYDARGFGQSGGYADVAGPASMRDLDSVLDWVAAHYLTNGRVGVVGQSYGGGEAYLAWAKNPRITTAVPMYGWVDLADALIPNNVPKLEWAQFLYGYGLVGAHGRYDPMIHDWYSRIYTRDGLDKVRADMKERSALPLLSDVKKPLFVCQGLQETLFPQADQAWTHAGGFTRALTYTGGHGSDDATCWSRALDWFQFFLAGHDTRVDLWPALESADASGKGETQYAELPRTLSTTYHLRAPDLVAAAAQDATFTVRQSPSTLWGEPSGLSDVVGGAPGALPGGLQNDPSAITFTTVPLDKVTVLVGAATATLHVQSGAAPYQVAAALLRLQSDGSSQVLGHAAFAALNGTSLDGTLSMRFEWTHAQLAVGDRIQLRIAANDEGFWMPLLADYAVTFDGTSTLELPFGDA